MRGFTSLLLAFFFVLTTYGQTVTVTLGSGSSTSNAGSSEPSPYNEYEPNQHMQFVYTASEIKAAGGSAGWISEMGWKVNSVLKNSLPGYNIRMKNTSAVNASSHDGNNLKVVLRSYTYPPGSTGWQMLTLDSTFYWDGTSSILIDVCYGTLSGTGAAGSIYMYNNIPNQRRGEVGKGASCSSGTSTAYYMKPFVQFTLDPDCAVPLNVKATKVTSNSATVTWDQALSGAQGYEYVMANSSGTPTSPGTYTTDTVLNVTGLCPSKLQFFYIRSVCSKGDTSDWSNPMVFQTKAGGGISSNSPVCVDDTLKLSVESAKSYSWTGPGGFKSTSQTQSIPNAVLGNAGSYVVSIVDQNQCNVTYTTTVRVDTLPVLTVTHNSPICAENDLQLDVSGADEYSWSGPNGFTSDTAINLLTDIQEGQSGTYSVTGTNSFNCSSNETVNVVVNSLPSISVTGQDTICGGMNIQFAVTGNGTSYQWYGPQGFQDTMRDLERKNAVPAYSGNYILIARSNEGCERSYARTIHVKPQPSISFNGDTVVCERNEFELIAQGAVTYGWLNELGSIINTTQNFKRIAKLSDAGIYTIQGQGSNGCYGRKEFSLTVLKSPFVNPTASTDLCVGDPIQLAGSTDGTSYGWTGPNGYTSTKMSDMIAPSTKKDSGLFTFWAELANGCRSEWSVPVAFKPTPEISVDKQGNNLQATTGFDNYTWFKDGQEISGATNALYTVTSLGTYKVSTSNNVGCADTSADVIVTSLGVREIDFLSIRMYPNPADESFYLQSTQRVLKVEMYDVLGHRLMEVSQPDLRQSFDVSEVSQGSYVIVVTSEYGQARAVLSIQ